MKNNNVTNPPEIKKNLFKLTKKSKNEINKIIPTINIQTKSINESKLRNIKTSKEKHNYSKFNSFLSETTPLQNIINQINIENNFITNINHGKENLLLSDRTNKIYVNKNNNKNENNNICNNTINLSKNVAEIIKRRITQKEIENIKNKVKRINKTKKTKLLSSKTVSLNDFKKTCLNNYNSNIITNNNKTKKIKPKFDISSINIKQRNRKSKNDLNDLDNDKTNKKYLETRRISVDWSNDENKDIENLTDKIIKKEKEKEENQNNFSKLNLSFGENESKYNMSNTKRKDMNINSNSFKKNNYDYDSFDEKENKSNKKINVNIIKSINNSNNKNYEKNKNKGGEGNYVPIISISNYGDNKKDVYEEKNIINQNDNIKENNSDVNKNNLDMNEQKEEVSKIKKDKIEIENIQKIISNTVESLNINLNNKKFNSIENSQKINHINVLKRDVNQDNLTNNNVNINRNMTYSRKILSSRLKNNNSNSCHKFKPTSEKMIKSKKNSKDKLNISHEGIKLNKTKNVLINDRINNTLHIQKNNSNNSFIKPSSSSNFFSLNNCCYNLNNNTNNIFYEITSPSSDFLLRLNNNSTSNKYRYLKLNNSFANENQLNNSSFNNLFFINNKNQVDTTPFSKENINMNYSKDILNKINFEDFFILDNKLNSIKIALSSKKKVINESFEYLNYFYNSSIHQNIDNLFYNIIDINFIKIYLFYKLLSIIICYDCSIDNNIFEQTHLLLKETIDLNYKNTIMIYEYLLENIFSLNDINLTNNIWLIKIKNLVIAFKNSQNNDEINEFLYLDNKNTDIPYLQKINTNINYIINNINIIISNIKSKNSQCIISLFKSIKNNSISFKDIFHNFFTYILYLYNVQGSLIGQALINLNITKDNKTNNILIPYIKTKNLKKYSLVLDLEETLLHFRKDRTNDNEGTVDIRSGTLKFLDDISEFYELIIFNEGEKKYTDLLIDSLEENKIYFEHRFYREHIIFDNNDIVKDLVRIGRNLDKILIIDNMKQNFKLQKENGILIKSFYGENEHSLNEDNILMELAKILNKIAKDGGDIRNGLVKYKNEIINKVTLGNNNVF